MRCGANGSGCKHLEYTHVLSGFSNPPMTLSSAWLTVYAYDEGDTEVVEFKINLDDGGELSYSVASGSTLGAPSTFAFNATWETEAITQTSLAATPVPEPARLLLLGAGLLATAARLKRRRKI